MYYTMVLSPWSPDQMHQHCLFLGPVRSMDLEVGGWVGVSAIYFINFQVILMHAK